MDLGDYEQIHQKSCENCPLSSHTVLYCPVLSVGVNEMLIQNPISAVPELFVNIKLTINGNYFLWESDLKFQNYTCIIVYAKESGFGKRIVPKPLFEYLYIG